MSTKLLENFQTLKGWELNFIIMMLESHSNYLKSIEAENRRILSDNDLYVKLKASSDTTTVEEMENLTTMHEKTSVAIEVDIQSIQGLITQIQILIYKLKGGAK